MDLEPLKKFSRDRWKLDDTHGMPHWNRVFENGQKLAVPGVDRDVVGCFAYLHDIGRIDNGQDPEHGPRSAKIVATLRDTLLKNLSDTQFATLLKACELHTKCKRTDNLTINTCFDADRLDLPRVGIIPDPAKMATEKGKELAAKVQARYEKSRKGKRRKIVYVDMDNVLVDFNSALKSVDKDTLIEYGKGGPHGRPDKDCYDDIPGLFENMQPLGPAVEAVKFLVQHFDVYILTTAPWNNPSAWSAKLNWVKKYLAGECYKRLIITHHKELCIGDYLIDDSPNNGAKDFGKQAGGEWLQFGSDRFPGWNEILGYIMKKEIADL